MDEDIGKPMLAPGCDAIDKQGERLRQKHKPEEDVPKKPHDRHQKKLADDEESAHRTRG